MTEERRWSDIKRWSDLEGPGQVPAILAAAVAALTTVFPEAASVVVSSSWVRVDLGGGMGLYLTVEKRP